MQFNKLPVSYACAYTVMRGLHHPFRNNFPEQLYGVQPCLSQVSGAPDDETSLTHSLKQQDCRYNSADTQHAGTAHTLDFVSLKRVDTSATYSRKQV